MCILQGSQLESVLGAQRQKFVQMIARELHRDQPWFHGSIERETADMVMLESGHQDGKFLYVDPDSAVLSLINMLFLINIQNVHRCFCNLLHLTLL